MDRADNVLVEVRDGGRCRVVWRVGMFRPAPNVCRALPPPGLLDTIIGNACVWIEWALGMLFTDFMLATRPSGACKELLADLRVRDKDNGHDCNIAPAFDCPWIDYYISQAVNLIQARCFRTRSSTRFATVNSGRLKFQLVHQIAIDTSSSWTSTSAKHKSRNPPALSRILD
jgi:hypothetical protein